MKFSLSETTDLIRHRRTIYPKDYSDRVVQREMIERIIANGTWAPNHGMTQPWRFTVFTGAEREPLSLFIATEYARVTPPEKFLQKKLDTMTQRVLQSSVVIGLGMERDPNGKISERDELLATACAVQNMHLTCTAYGLGAFWASSAALTGEGMRRFLKLSDEGIALGLFYMGYPSVEWPKGYRKPLEHVVRWAGEDTSA